MTCTTVGILYTLDTKRGPGGITQEVIAEHLSARHLILQHELGQCMFVCMYVCMFVCMYVYLSVTLLYACADQGARRRGMHVYESRSGLLDARGTTPSLPSEAT